MLYYFTKGTEDIRRTGFFASEHEANKFIEDIGERHLYSETQKLKLRFKKPEITLACALAKKNKRTRILTGELKLSHKFPQKRNHFITANPETAEVTFFANFANMYLGRTMHMKYGKYLRKFYPHLSNEQVTKLTDELYQIVFVTEFYLAKTPEEIEHVYRHGPQSCMKSERWLDNPHPCRVYGAGDLAVAYTKQEGKIQERCVVWPAKKFRYTTYTEQGARCNLGRLLTEAGYQRTTDAFGAKLRKEYYIDPEEDEDTNFILMPYTDFDHGFMIMDDHLIGEEHPEFSSYDEDECMDEDGYVWGKCTSGIAHNS